MGTFLDPCHDNWSGISTQLNFRRNFFFRSNRNEKITRENKFQTDTTQYKKILKVRKHGIAAVDAANMADIALIQRHPSTNRVNSILIFSDKLLCEFTILNDISRINFHDCKIF